MEANELRLSNIVDYNGVNFKIYSVRSPEPNADDYYNDKSIITIWNNGLADVCIDDLNPIPLTEEWLIKFGFEKTKGYVFKIDKFSLFDHNYDQGNLFLKLNSQNVPLINIKYVHQLQNLYFALTGKELPTTNL